ncbi:hypothetical protein ABPG75_012469 [Micractinium tetrahymenae]
MPIAHRDPSNQHAPRAPVCLLLLCGLPGAGKTSVARILAQQASQQGLEVRLISFDELGCQPSGSGGGTAGDSDGSESFDATAWQQARLRALAAVEAALRLETSTSSTACGGLQERLQREPCQPQQQHPQQPSAPPAAHRLVIADDNMQLRSMRWQCYSLARAARAAAVLLYVRCSEQLALQRNAARPPAQRVPADVIARMAQKLEEPAGGSSSSSSNGGACTAGSSSSDGACTAGSSSSDGACTASSSRGSRDGGGVGGIPADEVKNNASSSSAPAWEAASLVVWDSSQALQPATAAALWQQVWQRWGPAAPPLRDATAEAAARAAAQAVTAASLAHALDVATRQVLSECMGQLAAAAQQGKKVAAQRLNAARRQLLQEAAAAGLDADWPDDAAQTESAHAAAAAEAPEARGGEGARRKAGEAAVAAAVARWAAAYRQQCQTVLQELQPC